MDFGLSSEQRDYRARLRLFFEQEVDPRSIVALDYSGTFPHEAWSSMAEFGLPGLGLPSEYGGTPVDEITMCLAVEEVARASASLIHAWMPTTTFAGRAITLFGSAGQKQHLLPAICSGQVRVAMGLTEPAAGSDLGDLTTTALRDGDELVVNGHKAFTTGADTSAHVLALVRTDPQARPSTGMSMVLVPCDAPGVEITTGRKLSGQGVHACEVRFTDVRVPVDNVVGTPGAGLRQVLSLLDVERVYVGAICTGIAQGALDLATAHARSRVQFGKPIIEHQAVAHMLADMAIDVRTARLTTWEAAWRITAGIPCSAEAAMTKVIASEAATRCVSAGMQVLGGYSYLVEHGMERYWREVKLNEIAGGTNQIQRTIIARHLG